MSLRISRHTDHADIKNKKRQSAGHYQRMRAVTLATLPGHRLALRPSGLLGWQYGCLQHPGVFALDRTECHLSVSWSEERQGIWVENRNASHKPKRVSRPAGPCRVLLFYKIRGVGHQIFEGVFTILRFNVNHIMF